MGKCFFRAEVVYWTYYNQQQVLSFLSVSQGFKDNTVGRYFTWHQSERRKISEASKINCLFCEKYLSLFILLFSIFISIKFL